MSASKTLAQESWFWQNPLPQGNALLSVRFLSATTIVAVGDAGTIIRSTDGGSSWQTASTGTTSIFVGLSFANANVGLAAGFGGTIMRTTDGGSTWVQQVSGTTRSLYSIFMVNQNNATAVGDSGRILRTTNGGTTWSGQTTTAGDVHVAVFFTDSSRGTVSGGGGRIYRTTDAGVTWTSQTSGTTAQLSGIHFLDANVGTIVGSGGTILRTANGGTTWTPQTSGSTAFLWGVSFTDANTGLVSGSNGTVLRTANGGATWTPQTTGTTNQLYGISSFDANTVMTAGVAGTILKTTNAGALWTNLTGGTTAVLRSVFFSDVNNGTTVGDVGTILRTTNGGALWASQGSGTTNSLGGVWFANSTTGTTVGDGGIIRRTANGGLTWTSQTSGTAANLTAVVLNGTDTATTVGGSGVILRTTNGGITWTPQTSGTAVNLWGVAFLDANKGIAVGDVGTIRFTGNGGATWSGGTGGGTQNLNAVTFLNTDTAIAVGNNGTILKSVNGGATWTSQTSGVTNALRGVAFTSPTVGTIVGTAGKILRTTNAGTTWTNEASPVANAIFGATFNAVCVTQFKKRVAVGSGGMILTTGSFRDSAAVSTTVSFPASPTASTDYRLFSMPGVSRSRTVSTFVSGEQNKDWKIFRDNGAATSFLVPLTADSTLVSGEGYWLLRKGNVSFSGTIAVPPLSPGDVYPVTLHSGWNIIANPFDKSVASSAVRSVNTLLDTVKFWAYGGTSGYSSSLTLSPFAGYYFFNDPGFNLTTGLKVPYPFAPPGPAKIGSDGLQWRLQLAFQSDINADAENIVGVSDRASDNQDRFDTRKPPLFLDQGFLYFSRPEWDATYPRFSSDIRPPSNKGHVWTFEVSNPRMSDGMIHVLGLDQIPNGYVARLINLQNSVPVDLSIQSEYRYQTTAPLMSFELVVGTPQFVNDELSKTVPAEFSLDQNFPNPFNPSTSISYAVPRDANVRLEIYSVLGQRVAVLAQGPHVAGVYTLRWDATGLASGVYFSRLFVDNNPVQSRKMMLLR